MWWQRVSPLGCRTERAVVDRGDFADTTLSHQEVRSDLRNRQSEDLFPLDDFEALLAARDQTNISASLRNRIDRHLQKRFPSDLTSLATGLLHQNQPQMSALSPLSSWQRSALLGTPIALILSFFFFPKAAATASLCAVFLYCIASTTLKGALMLASLKPVRKIGPTDLTRTPIVTLFLPVHKEDRAIIALVSELNKIDYPTEKMDIKFLAEATDKKTLDALTRLELPAHFSILEIPQSTPQTKPKAMNYALPFARGEIIGIYDAEDAPEPDQVRKAVAALEVADERTVCVQSRLNHYAATETFISRMASLEYTLWFDMLLLGLSNLQLPVPLGGTSLFIRGIA